MAKILPVKGTRDFYPEQMAIRNWITRGWQDASRRNGFVEYDGPIFEYLQLYTQKSGEEIASQLFSLTDRGGRQLAIRPEITPTLARMVNQQINALPRPIKWFSVPRLCRAERPQKGRLREFFQWNIDIVGSDSIMADAESIFTAVDYLRSVGLTPADIVVRISSRSMLAALLKARGFDPEKLDTLYGLLDKRAKLSEEAFLELAREQIPDKSLRDKLMEIQAVRSLDELRAMAPPPVSAEVAVLDMLFSYLEQMGVGEYCQFDITIVRGLAYYTGPVFEIFDRNSRLRAICGGGRYDNLLAGLGGQNVPATGFGMGDVVLEILLREKNLLKPPAPQMDFFVAAAGDDLYDKLLEVVSRIRTAGCSAGFDYRRTSLGKQLKLAAAQGARFVVILGQETIQDWQVSIKRMADGEQIMVPFQDFLLDPQNYIAQD